MSFGKRKIKLFNICDFVKRQRYHFFIKRLSILPKKVFIANLLHENGAAINFTIHGQGSGGITNHR